MIIIIIIGTLYVDQYKFRISHSLLLRMGNVAKKKVAEKIKTRISCAIVFFQKSCHLGDNVKKIWKSQAGHR